MSAPMAPPCQPASNNFFSDSQDVPALSGRASAAQHECNDDTLMTFQQSNRKDGEDDLLGEVVCIVGAER